MTESDDSTWFSMVLSTSRAKAGMLQIEFSGAHFVDFWSQGLKMLKSTLLEFILVTSGAKAWKCSNRLFWSSFCRLLEPRPENVQIDRSGVHFVDFWSQGQNASNRTFGSSFCRLVEPRPQCLKSNLLGLILCTSGAKAGMQQIEPSGAHFVDFWSQGRKVFKSTLLDVIVRSSRAKARKCSNPPFWSPFCRKSTNLAAEI